MDKYIYAKNSVEFVTVGVEFCAFLERVEQLTQEEFASTAIKLLPLLYLKATLLPIDEENEDYLDAPEHFVTEDEYDYLRGDIERLMGENDAYLVVQSDDMKYSDLPLGASIAEDMADLYQAVKDCISAYRTENEDTMRAALTECREEFASYWGSKLLNALAALHRIYYNTSDLLDDEYECECGHHHGHDHHHDENENFYQKTQSAWSDDDEDADRWL